MPTPISGIAGLNNDRNAPTSADVVAEARQRLTERLRTLQAETEKPSEVVQDVEKAQERELARRDEMQHYRVRMNPDTRRLYTEVLDQETGEVIVRIPATYVDPAESADAAPQDAGAGMEA
ncbi:flagellar protein FlaG [Azospirillum sp. TSO22-1]|uniref:flagellar protein FlaG n=1 Tax=Azospirillum sp. TSO22-1 TaxID=716789 RepID=UPI000D60C986|nr:flagellar protein FlaG [Azospirillum sp. TSO22-1]PWC35165.1 hypothetical protein TSO221_30315 [Azospirillum sp. TSO22-1]